MHQKNKGIHERFGFTLVEVLVVIAILMILFGLLVNAVAKSRDAGKKALAGKEVGMIKTACEQYYEFMNIYPADTDWAASGGTNPESSGSVKPDKNSLYTSLGKEVTNPETGIKHEAFMVIRPNQLNGQLFVDPWLNGYEMDAWHSLGKYEKSKGYTFTKEGIPYDTTYVPEESRKADLKVWSKGPDTKSTPAFHLKIPLKSGDSLSQDDRDNICSF